MIEIYWVRPDPDLMSELDRFCYAVKNCCTIYVKETLSDGPCFCIEPSASPSNIRGEDSSCTVVLERAIQGKGVNLERSTKIFFSFSDLFLFLKNCLIARLVLILPFSKFNFRLMDPAVYYLQSPSLHHHNLSMNVHYLSLKQIPL